MFWRMNAGLNASSTLEATLDRALGGSSSDANSTSPFSVSGDTIVGGGMHNVLDQLLEEQDLLSELKAGNARLTQVLSAKDNVRSLLAWAVYGTDEIERHADAAERNVLESLVKQGGLDALLENRKKEHSGQPEEVKSATPVVPDEVERNRSSPSSSWGNLGNASPQPDLEGDARRQRYPHLATEILCTDQFQISETLWSDLAGLLGPIWDIILSSREDALGMPDVEGYPSGEAKQKLRAHVRYELECRQSERDEEDAKRREVIRGNWTRINGMLMSKRPAQMLRFIKDFPKVVSRLVDRIDSPAIQDTLLRIIACEEAGVGGVIEWLCEEALVTKLLQLLTPYESPSTHATVAEIIKAIISLTSPNAFNPNAGNGGDSQDSSAQETSASQNQDGNVQTAALANRSPNSDATGTAESSPEGGAESNTSPGQRDNRLIRDLVLASHIAMLVEPMHSKAMWRKAEEAAELSELASDSLVEIDLQESDAQIAEDNVPAGSPRQKEPSGDRYSFDPYRVEKLPSAASISSSFCQSITILIELIRKNNSDYSEPYLFHSIRNRLMGMQQRKVENRFQAKEKAEANDSHTSSLEEDAQDRQDMEDTMAEMSEKLGIVHLGPLLSQISDRIGDLQSVIKAPRDVMTARTPGVPNPLTAERFRIVELYAEMLHCSNMSILNRPEGSGPDYTTDGRLKGGLDALEQLGAALEGANNAGSDNEAVLNEVTPAKDLPVSSSGSTDCSLTGSDDELEERNTLSEQVENLNQSEPSNTTLAVDSNSALESEEDEPSTPKQRTFDDMAMVMEKLSISGDVATAEDTAPSRRLSILRSPVDATGSFKRNAEHEGPPLLAIGDVLKQMYIDQQVLPSVTDLFFEHPSNNFLHNVTYDIVQQVLNGRINQGYNQRLVCELFQTAKIAERILHTQKINAQMSQGRRSRRLGLMGHMLLIADEIEKFFERCPADLYDRIKDSFIRSEWDAFVAGELKESRQRDSQPLGGGRPVVHMQPVAAKQDYESNEDDEGGSSALSGQPLTRSASTGDSFGFGSTEEDFKFRAFNRFLTNETYSGPFASSDEDSDDSSSESPRANRSGRQQMLSDGFDSAFSPSSETDDMDDGFGDFHTADPFGDSFETPYQTPMRMSIHANRPMTAADFANQAFREQFAGESSQLDSDTDEDDDDQHHEVVMTAGSMGDDSFESAAQFLAANWSVPGGEVEAGEDLPPAKPVDVRRLSGAGRSSSRSSSTDSNSNSSTNSSPETIKGIHPAARLGRNTSRSLAISPPDPTLVRATDAQEPYGHGVSVDTKVRDDGKLVRNINGREVTAPQDDISLAANHARKASR